MRVRVHSALFPANQIRLSNEGIRIRPYSQPAHAFTYSIDETRLGSSYEGMQSRNRHIIRHNEYARERCRKKFFQFHA